MGSEAEWENGQQIVRFFGPQTHKISKKNKDSTTVVEVSLSYLSWIHSGFPDWISIM